MSLRALLTILQRHKHTCNVLYASLAKCLAQDAVNKRMLALLLRVRCDMRICTDLLLVHGVMDRPLLQVSGTMACNARVGACLLRERKVWSFDSFGTSVDAWLGHIEGGAQRCQAGS
jgi:hypothetical protein